MRFVKLFVFIAVLTFFYNNVWAQSCTPMSCASMGYVQSELDCDGKNFVRCPFDRTAVFCGGSDCGEAVQNCSRCEEMCGGNCVRCSTCSYTNINKPENCETAPSCSYSGTTYYSDTCTTCSYGYKLDVNGYCIVDCEYTLTSVPDNCASYDSCQRDGITYYECTSCDTGYEDDYSGGCVCEPTVSCSDDRTCLRYCEGNCVYCQPCGNTLDCMNCKRTCDGNCVECVPGPVNCPNSSCEAYENGECIQCAIVDASAPCDIFDGKGNTEALVEELGAGSPPAMACHMFYPPEISPSDTKLGAGTWYVPAIGELIKMYGFSGTTTTKLKGSDGMSSSKGKSKINTALDKLGSSAKGMNSLMASSSITDTGTSYIFNASNGSRDAYVQYMDTWCFNFCENCATSGVAVGDIFYNDMTTSTPSNYSSYSSKKPIAIVAAVEGANLRLITIDRIYMFDTIDDFDPTAPYSKYTTRGARMLLPDYYDTEIAGVARCDTDYRIKDSGYSYW